ncbi:MAG: methyltransferase domain-containing protein [Acidimicrobiia bacterium]
MSPEDGIVGPGLWSDVDAQPDTGYHVEYLDAAARALADQRQRSYEAMALAPGAVVADVGCGSGIALAELARIVGAAGRVVGIDPSAAMLAEAGGRAAKLAELADGGAVTDPASAGRPAPVELVKATAAATGLPEAAFDAVRTERVLMHVADPLAAVGELARITRPGGRVVLLEPDHRRLAIDSDDPGLVHQLSGIFGNVLPNGSAGLRARSDALRAGLVDVTVDVIAQRFESFAAFGEVFCFDIARRFIVGTGLVDAAGFEGMVADLAARDAEGRFLAVAMFYLVTATKPA